MTDTSRSNREPDPIVAPPKSESLIGTDIGSYQVIRELGRGGMGVVYLAYDRDLGRHVAIKGIPEEVSQDADRLDRLEREAKALAALSHPNVATILGFMEANRNRYLVLEYVRGDTLQQRLQQARLSTAEAISIAKQLAAAIEAAHQSNIIHRDLKPANIKFTSTETANDNIKVLDFGLARVVAPQPLDQPAATATIPGVILGTPGYLSPEQARGLEADERSDIFSFGCVLYEMLAGKPAFDGRQFSELLGAVLEREVDLSCLPAELPAPVRRVVRRCLVKDKNQRLQSIADARIELEETLDESPAEVRSARTRLWQGQFAKWAPWLLAAILATALFSLWTFNRPRKVDKNDRMERWPLSLPDGLSVDWKSKTPLSLSSIGFSKLIAVSTDGNLVCNTFDGNRSRFYLKTFDSWDWRPLSFTEDARAPLFSPDGQSIAFLREERLHVMRLPDGPTHELCRVVSTGFEATWTTDGNIIYAADNGLWKVADNGLSVPTRFLESDTKDRPSNYRFPHVSSSGNWLLVTVVSNSGVDVAIADLRSEHPEMIVILRNASDARLLSSSHVVFARGDSILTATFDPANPGELGKAQPIASGIHTSPGLNGILVSHFDVTDHSLLAYVPASTTSVRDILVWVDGQNPDTEITGGKGKWRHPRLSPDGKRILFDVQSSSGTRDLFIYEIERDLKTQLTFKGSCFNAEWSRSDDGQSIVYCAGAPRGRAVYRVASDFSGTEKEILSAQPGRWLHLSSATPDGESLIFWDRGGGGLWVLPSDGNGQFTEYLNTAANERWGVLSPAGDYIAYVASEQGVIEVFVQSYPMPKRRIQVSAGGGSEPLWAHDGSMIFYRKENQLYSAAFDRMRRDFELPARLLVEGDYNRGPPGHQHYDVSLDGSKFLMVKEGKSTPPTQVHFYRNWHKVLAE